MGWTDKLRIKSVFEVENKERKDLCFKSNRTETPTPCIDLPSEGKQPYPLMSASISSRHWDRTKLSMGNGKYADKLYTKTENY